MQLVNTPRDVIQKCVTSVAISITPTALDFGTLDIGDSVIRTFYITNVSSSDVDINVSSLTFPYTAYTADWNSGTIAQGETQTVNVTFLPTLNGTFDGDIVVNSNANVGANTVFVSALVDSIAIDTALSLWFDAINDYFESPLHFKDIWNNSAGFTVSFWANISSLNNVNTRLIDFNPVTAGEYCLLDSLFILNYVSGRIEFTTPKNQLVNITLVKAGTTVADCKVYVNNSTASNVVYNNTIKTMTDNPTKITVGTYVGHGFYANMRANNLCIFDRALTPTEVTKLYNKVISNTCKANLVFFTPLDFLEKVGAHVYSEEEIASKDAKLVGYATGAKGIVNTATGADVQTVP